jgi:hypothetical protein
MRSSRCTRQVLALSAGLPVAVVDAILTATESALLRQGATGIRLDTSQPGIVVLADFPLASTGADAEPPVEELRLSVDRTPVE